MNVERRLRDALGQVGAYPPSPDLFPRLRRTVLEDAAHRRRVRVLTGSCVGGVILCAAWLLVTGDVVDGRLAVPGWALEVVVTTFLVANTVVLAPALRRFGAAYLADTLDGRTASQAFVPLLEVAYHLLCAGYVLVTVSFAPDVWSSTVGPGSLARAAGRVGGLALLLGLTHAITITALPLLGLLLADVRWRTAATGATRDTRAVRADRFVRFLVGGFAAAMTLVVVLALVGVLVVGIGL